MKKIQNYQEFNESATRRPIRKPENDEIKKIEQQEKARMAKIREEARKEQQRIMREGEKDQERYYSRENKRKVVIPKDDDGFDFQKIEREEKAKMDKITREAEKEYDDMIKDATKDRKKYFPNKARKSSGNRTPRTAREFNELIRSNRIKSCDRMSADFVWRYKNGKVTGYKFV